MRIEIMDEKLILYGVSVEMKLLLAFFNFAHELGFKKIRSRYKIEDPSIAFIAYSPKENEKD